MGLDSFVINEVFVKGFIVNKFFFFEKLFIKGIFMGRLLVSDVWEIVKVYLFMVNIDYNILLVLLRVYN